jgi:V8-like Glu-specific endopeptidase
MARRELAEFIDIQRRLVDTLLRIPVMATFSGRSSLLQGLPPAPLSRSEGFDRLDLNNIISGLQQLGRLTGEGGTRPVMVVVDNAMQYVPPGSEAGHALAGIQRELAAYYGGETQVEAVTQVADLEALVFGRQRDNRLPFSFVAGAGMTARGVARLSVPRIFGGVRQAGAGYGTGWLIAPGVVITNHHVIEARDRRPPPAGPGEAAAEPADLEAQAQHIEAWFDYYQEVGGNAVRCDGARLLARNRELDYAVLELTDADKVADRRPLPIIRQQPSLARGSRINLVQHPGGGPLQYAIRNNFFVRVGSGPQFIRYQTDTESGSSGSPVCDDNWQVLGLHHSSVKVPPEQVPQELLDGQPVAVTVLNEAIAIHAVLDDLPPPVKGRIRLA